MARYRVRIRNKKMQSGRIGLISIDQTLTEEELKEIRAQWHHATEHSRTIIIDDRIHYRELTKRARIISVPKASMRAALKRIKAEAVLN